MADHKGLDREIKNANSVTSLLIPHSLNKISKLKVKAV